MPTYNTLIEVVFRALLEKPEDLRSINCSRTDLFSSFLLNKSNGSQTRPHFVEIGLTNH